MTKLLLALLAMTAACDRAKVDAQAREIAELRAQAAALTAQATQLRLDVAQKDEEQKLLAGVARAAFEKEAARGDEVTRAFTAQVAEDPDGYARFTGRRIDAILDERGEVRDPTALAEAVRAKAIKQWGAGALGVLVHKSGAAVGAAIYYGRIGRPSGAGGAEHR